MRLEQAIFTSVRSERLDGYQLAARSSGVSDELAKELTNWGPAHDSLWTTQFGNACVNFHGLADGRYCISQTTLSGAEYSGRGGGRVYTQMIVVPAEGIVNFGGDPFLIVRALTASGRMMVYEAVPRELVSIPLIGRCGAEPPSGVGEVAAAAGAEAMTELTAAALDDEPVTVTTDLPVERLFQALIYELQPQHRLTLSFSTGLKPSSRRPFKFTISPNDPSLVRKSQRRPHGKAIEVLTADPDRPKPKRLTTVRGR